MANEGGEQAYDYRSYCQDDAPGYMRSANGEIWQYQAEWWRSLAQPLEEGYSWMFATRLVLAWHFVGKVAVAAGSFDDCWERTATDPSNGYVASRTYCHGVGPVKSSNSDGEQASLVSYLIK